MTPYKSKNQINVEARVEGDGVKYIEFAHCAVHDDTFVIASEYDDDVDIAGPNYYLIKPLDGYELHCVFNIQASAAVKIELFEGTYVSADGTPLLHMRNNRNSEILYNERETTFKGPTIVDNGTLIHATFSGGSGTNPNNRIGGETRNGEEIILNPAEYYMIKVTATANDTKLSFANEYYEVEL